MGRFTKFSAVLYPDCESHCNAFKTLDAVAAGGGLTYCRILHDRDVDSESCELKKPHWHVLISTDKQTSFDELGALLGIESRLFENCRKFQSACAYLVHRNNPDKFQYSLDSITGPMADDVRDIIARVKIDDNIAAMQIFNFIENYPVYQRISYTDITRWALQNGYYGSLRRMGYILSQLILEHNQSI